MTGHVQAVKSWLGQVLDGGASASGSLAYRNNRKAIWRGDILKNMRVWSTLFPASA